MTSARHLVHTSRFALRFANMDALGHDGMIYADGAAKTVWVDLATGKSTPLPEDIAAPLRKPRKEAP